MNKETVKVEIYKDFFIAGSRPWRAKITFQDGKTFSTEMFSSVKALKETCCANTNFKYQVIRRKDLDCRY